ncbi:hypothetical protein GBA52_020727 [Prunus armeniaca]|nr:hypothetical protein GBA52_020727 [Prunus armeniaca]
MHPRRRTSVVSTSSARTGYFQCSSQPRSEGNKSRPGAGSSLEGSSVTSSLLLAWNYVLAATTLARLAWSSTHSSSFGRGLLRADSSTPHNGSRTPCFSISAHKVTHPKGGVLGLSSPVGTLSMTLFDITHSDRNRSNFYWVMLLGCSSFDHPSSSNSDCDPDPSPNPELATGSPPVHLEYCPRHFDQYPLPPHSYSLSYILGTQSSH